MSACVCSVAAPVAAARARVAPRASGAKGVVVARGKGKVSGPARLAARSSTDALRAAKPAASRRGSRVITAASADDEEPVRVPASLAPPPRPRVVPQWSPRRWYFSAADRPEDSTRPLREIRPPLALTPAPSSFIVHPPQIPFGYTRQDVILIGVGMTAAGFGLYYGLQANGVSAIWAGNIVQLTFVLGLSLAWVASYVLRVMNKDMTYVKQLKDYEDAVMAKRLEELPEAELEKMMDDISKLDPK